MINLSDIAKHLGSSGGKKSAKSRLENKTKDERSEIMRKLNALKKKKSAIIQVNK